MDAELVFWTAALVNMAALTGIAVFGVHQIRRGAVANHQRSMVIAASLVLAFVVAYGFKLALLGREDLERWSNATIGTLRVHELCVFVMVIAGTIALRRGRALRRKHLVGQDEDTPAADAKLLESHRRMGRIALAGALLGLASASLALAGMYARI